MSLSGSDHLLGRQISKRGSEERASKAIADSVHLTLAGRSPNNVQRDKRAFEHVILEAFMSETLVWIDPGNHKYHMLAVERTCPIGAVIGGRAQTVHSAQRGRAGVRPPGGVDEP
jgi:hypothetical protein